MKQVLVLLILSVAAAAQSKVETIANVGIRAADVAQTCYHLHLSPPWREQMLPTQSCAGVAGISAGFAVSAWYADRWLTRHNHARLAHFQIVSAAGAAVGISYTFAH